jgi:hypothetical protein
MSLFRLVFTFVLCLSFQNAYAQFDAAGFKQALKLKKNVYTSDGSTSGGDRSSSSFRVSQIRVAANPAGYDRLVVEIQGNSGGEKTSLTRPPFYMVENDPSNKRIVVTVYGKAKLDFSRLSAAQQAKKTHTVSKLEYLPVLDSDRWSFVVHTQVPVKSEVFELSEPSRIIIDLKP